MTPVEFRAGLADLGWSHRTVSGLTGVHWNTIGNWAAGRTPIPRWIPLLLDLARMVRGLQERLTG